MTKTILITGASRGIGRATAIRCGALGWSVAVNYLSNDAAAHETVADVEAAGGRAGAFQGDVGTEDGVLSFFDNAARAFGAPDGVVNNAGIVAPAEAFQDYSAERIARIFRVNAVGAFLVAREAARRLDDGGAIVNVSSVAARLGSPDEYIDYAASKGAVDTMTIGLAKELAPRGIRVNAVRPGVTETDIHASGNAPDRAWRVGRTVPLGRPGKPEEMADAIVFLLSDASAYTTGAFLDVTGGR